MENHLKRVLNLVKKTGDTMIVVDKEGEDSFVVMDLDHYEALLDETIGEPDDHEDFEMDDGEASNISEKTPDLWDVMQSAGDDGATWDMNELNDEEIVDLERQYQEFASRNVQEAIQETKDIPVQGQKPVEESGKDAEDEFGEEQFYLEPVE